MCVPKRCKLPNWWASSGERIPWFFLQISSLSTPPSVVHAGHGSREGEGAEGSVIAFLLFHCCVHLFLSESALNWQLGIGVFLGRLEQEISHCIWCLVTFVSVPPFLCWREEKKPILPGSPAALRPHSQKQGSFLGDSQRRLRPLPPRLRN